MTRMSAVRAAFISLGPEGAALSGADRMYRPSLADLSWAHTLRPATALIVGRPTEALLAALRPLGVEVRSTEAAAASLLKRGAYAVGTHQEWGLLLVPTGQEGRAEQAAA